MLVRRGRVLWGMEPGVWSGSGSGGVGVFDFDLATI